MGKRLSDKNRAKRAIKYKVFAKEDRKSNNLREPISKDNNEYWACIRKRYIRSREFAIVKARGLYERYPEQKDLYYYDCPHCKGFHLTHRPGEGSVLIKRIEE